MLGIGIVGCGTIGSALARAIEAGKIPARLAGLATRTRARAEELARALRLPPPVLDLPDLVRASDLVLEAATGKSLEAIVPACLREGKDVCVISVGGLLGHEAWFGEAEARGCRILILPGAIAGLDGVRGAAVGRVDSVTLTTRKPPRGLAGAPYVVEHGIDLDRLTEETLIFEGSAREACRGFPTNVNVSAALSFAGIGPDRTVVRILAVPGGAFNQHRIEVQGEFGRLAVEVENVPSATNPRTGLLSIFSTIAFVADYARTYRKS
ncbi:MAG TPA: aspartate dehydrogenase [Candidatus Methylomirabilis sp.]|nr:aspartate dehydrogenase [Candidatus Methylomirabilis sp.]